MPLLSLTEKDVSFEEAIRFFDCKDALAMETEVDDVVMDSGRCERCVFLHVALRPYTLPCAARYTLRGPGLLVCGRVGVQGSRGHC